MVDSPLVLDRAGRVRARPLEVIATPASEFLMGIEAFQFAEAVHTLDVNQDWFDRTRTRAGSKVLASLDRLGRIAWGSLLSAALTDRWPRQIGGLNDHVAAMSVEELWLLLAGRHIRPFADRVTPDAFSRAVRGDRAARALLAEADRESGGGKETANGVWDLSARDLHQLVVTVLRGWYANVFAPGEMEATRVLARDAGAKQRLRRTASDEALIEAATNGIVYVPEPWVRRIILTPHIAMRPWNVVCAHDDTYVICYPVADDSLGADPGSPPVSLVRLHKALGDERRLRILRLLARADMNLQELSEAVGLAKSTTHHHTVILRSAGLIRSSTVLENRYSLRWEAVDQAGLALRDFLATAGRDAPQTAGRDSGEASRR